MRGRLGASLPFKLQEIMWGQKKNIQLCGHVINSYSNNACKNM